MSPLVPLGRPGPADRERLRAVFTAGPWCWPMEIALAAQVQALFDLSPPETPAVGTSLGVSVSPDHSRATLWVLDTRPGARSDAALDGSSEETWEVASAVLPRALPLLWSSLRDARAARPRLTRVATWSRDGIAPVPEGSVGGTSFGLAFVLLLTSRLVGLPVPGNLACSVAIDATGRVTPVGGLEPKIAALLDFAPHVRRLLVAASQTNEAVQAIAACRSGRNIEIVPVKSVGHALEVVFGEDLLEKTLNDAGADPQKRAELARSFFRLALHGRGEFIDWTPIERAAHQASGWQGLDASEQYILEFTQAIAARHERNQGRLTLPPPEFLERWPRRLRAQVLPHIVQQSADTGFPEPQAVRECAQPFRPNPLRDGFLPELKLEGALARLDAVTGHPRRAIQTQFELARVYLDSFLPEEVSFPLSECYRLAGALGDTAAFERAEWVREEATAAGGLWFVGSPYVDLARARARLLLSRSDSGGPRTELARLALHTRLPAHVQWSAARWLHHCVPAERTEHAASSAALRAAASDPDTMKAHAARVQSALIQLDHAVGETDETGADRALATLREREPGLIDLLESWAPAGQLASHVARYYPY